MIYIILLYLLFINDTTIIEVVLNLSNIIFITLNLNDLLYLLFFIIIIYVGVISILFIFTLNIINKLINFKYQGNLFIKQYNLFYLLLILLLFINILHNQIKIFSYSDIFYYDHFFILTNYIWFISPIYILILFTLLIFVLLIINT